MSQIRLSNSLIERSFENIVGLGAIRIKVYVQTGVVEFDLVRMFQLGRPAVYAQQVK